jgi:hypothetical protein
MLTPARLGVEGLADRLASSARPPSPGEQRRIQVLPVVHLGARHHQGVALRHGLDGQNATISSSS